MDCENDESLSPNISFGTFWVRKKSRCEEEDFSPLQPENSQFLKLQYGPQTTKQDESMYSLINKELGLSLEGTKENVIPELNLVPAANGPSEPPTQLLLSPAGFVLETRNKQFSQSSSLLVATNVSNDSPVVQMPSTTSGVPGPVESCPVAKQDVETLVRKARSGRPTRKISMNLADTFDRSLLEDVKELRIEDNLTEKQPNPFCPLLPPSAGASVENVGALVEPIPIISGIRDRRRKTSAPPSLNPMLKENQKASNYFFTGSVFSATTPALAIPLPQQSDHQRAGQQIGTVEHSNKDLSTPLPEFDAKLDPGTPLRQLKPSLVDNFNLGQTTLLMEERASEAAELDPKPKLGRRRPRASALREMNFWAPQSS